MSKKGYETIEADENDDTSSSHPTKSASFLSLLTFWWMNSIFKTGSKRPLNQSDFLPLHEKDRTRDLTEGLQKEWNNHVQECNKTEGKQPRLWKCVLKMVSRKEILFILSFWLMDSICRVSLPVVLGVLLRSLSSAEMDHSLAFGCCLLLGLSGLSTTSTHYSAYLSELLGMRLSSAIKGIVYLKIPLVSQQNLRELTTGNVIDLISNDVQRIELAPKWIVTSSLAIFEFTAVVCLLLHLIGWQALMGVLFLMALIPCIMIISSVCAQLRRKTAEVTDRRLSLMNELVSGIRAIKTHAWEENYRDKVQEVRRNEVCIILKKNCLLSIIEAMSFTSGTAATFISVVTLVLTGHVTSSSTAFMLLYFMSVLRATLSVRLSSGIPLVLELFISLKRIQHFLLLPNMPLESLEDNQTSCSQESVRQTVNTYDQLWTRESPPKNKMDIERGITGTQDETYAVSDYDDAKKYKVSEKTAVHLSVSRLTCKVNELDREKYLLQEFSFVAFEKSLTVITGQVGSGKSTLLAAIAGEVTKSSGDTVCSGTIGYVPQVAWVFSGTLRENVLFGESFDRKRYAQVIEACALTEDINRFSNGDLTFVGEHGIVLSGGQRARISLARAVYADADVYLLDDPLSAVDAKVGKRIFSQCVCKLLQEKIIILATYAEKHMKAADQVVVLYKGSVLGKGTLDELKGNRKIIDTILDTSATAKEKKTTTGSGYRKNEEKETAHSGSSPISGSHIEHLEISEEEKATGKISSSLYWDYFRAGIHPAAMMISAVLFVASQAFMMSPNVWLSYLTKMPWDKQHQITTLVVYASLIIAALVFAVMRACLLFHVSRRSSLNFHNKMVDCLLKAPVLFFDTNAAGRILNRCSKDIGSIDEILPKAFYLAIQMFLFVLASALLPSFTNFWLFLLTLPVFVIFGYLAWYFLKTSRELRRWESICRSPVFSHFSETMAGLGTIRTRKKERDFIDQFYGHQDLHNQVFSMVAASTRWLTVRTDVLCSAFITGVAFAFVLLSLHPALTGLALAYVIETAKFSHYTVRNFSEVENLMTSVERVMAYTSLDSEPGYKIKTLPPINWPHGGHVSFRNVVMRYYPGGPQVLKNLSFEIEGKMKVGIVGRTGDGKSSIVAALLRMPEAEGEISIDDIPINSIQLQGSRKCISVLSQSPVLFSGSLRKNLDPLDKHRDDELWKVLEEVKLNSLVENLEGKLDYELLERGENLSVGERQLICLARTLLQQSKIVILDEPTANVDPITERTIWTTVHEKLKNSTVITIAHRLNTVKNCDVILVLREGQVAELDTIGSLMGREGGLFHEMAVAQNLFL